MRQLGLDCFIAASSFAPRKRSTHSSLFAPQLHTQGGQNSDGGHSGYRGLTVDGAVALVVAAGVAVELREGCDMGS